jgi:hypothetical protein
MAFKLKSFFKKKKTKREALSEILKVLRSQCESVPEFQSFSKINVRALSDKQASALFKNITAILKK